MCLLFDKYCYVAWSIIKARQRSKHSVKPSSLHRCSHCPLLYAGKSSQCNTVRNRCTFASRHKLSTFLESFRHGIEGITRFRLESRTFCIFSTPCCSAMELIQGISKTYIRHNWDHTALHQGVTNLWLVWNCYFYKCIAINHSQAVSSIKSILLIHLRFLHISNMSQVPYYNSQIQAAWAWLDENIVQL